MNAGFRREDEHVSVSAAQQGSLPAGRSIVERYQRDLLGAAYLLTGERTSAQELTERAFERAFEQLRAIEPEEELFPWLAGRMAALYLNPPENDHASPPAPRLPALAGEPERYLVDDDRSRARNALTLLDPAARLMLVLSDFAGLSARQIAVACGGKQDPGEVAEIVARARARLRQSAGLRDGLIVTVALREVAVESPRVNLWPEIEPEITALYARQRFRSRAYAWGAAGFAGLVIVGLLILLLYGALASGEDGTSGAANPSTPTTTFITATAIEQEPPAADAYVPLGEAPDHILVQIPGQPGEQPRLSIYDPVAGDLIELPAGELAGMSPDGGTLLFLERQAGPDHLNLTLVAVSTGTYQERWRADIGPLQASGPRSVFFDVIVVDELVYAASHDPDHISDVLSIAVIRLSDGGMRTFWGLDMNVTMGAQGIEVDLLANPAPLEPLLTIVVRSTQAGWTKVQQVDRHSGAEPLDSGAISGLAQPLAGRQLLPDGRGMYKIPLNGPTRRAAVPYLIFDTMTEGAILLPFEPIGTSGTFGTVIVEYVLSHDGRWLYAVSPYNRQVAVIDLDRRQLDRVIDLDGSSVPATTPEGLTTQFLGTYYQSNAAALSPDGRYLYALGPLRELPSGYSPAIWKIDTSTWTIVDEWSPGGSLSTLKISPSGDGSRLYAHAFFTRISSGSVAPGQLAAPETPQMLAIDVASGQILSTRDLVMLGTLADFYRDTYGRSPSVAGTVPQHIQRDSSIPAIDLDVDPQRAPGGDVTVSVTLLDPSNGEAITGTPPPEVRNGTPTSIIATFVNGAERRIAVLGRGAEGSYDGQALLDLPGVWDVTLSAGDPGAGGWSINRPGVVEIASVVQAGDGNEYELQIDGGPRAGRLSDLSIRFVPVDGSRFDPDDSTRLPVWLYLTLPDGSRPILYRSGVATYSNAVRFPSPGILFPTVSFPNFDGTETSAVIRVVVGE